MRECHRHRQSLLVLGLLALGLGVALGGCSTPNKPPEVRISSPSEGALHGGEIAFEAEAHDPDGRIEAYRWTFGDGAVSSEPRPTHEYAQSGEYRVEVTVTDDRGETATDGITIEVQVGPKAVATLRDPQSEEGVILQYMSGEAPLMVAFNGSRSRPEPGTQIVEYHWDFGDGEASTEPNPVHIYTEAGEFQAALTVTDERGRSDRARVVVEVVSYEPVEETLELEGMSVTYRLYPPKESRSSSMGISMFYKYVVDAPRRLSEDEIRMILADIVGKAQGRPDVARITAHLFDAAKEGFMIPRDYAHYLGTMVWDRTAPSAETLSFAVNRAYLDGTAAEVLGYKIREELLDPGDPDCGPLCDRHRIALVSIYIQDEPLCRELLRETLREIARWRLSASYEGYLVNIYSRDVRQPLGQAIGTRPSERAPRLEQLPLQLFTDPPKQWDVKDETLWFSLGQVPSCEASP